MNFNGFVGNDNVKKELNQMIATGRLPHAIVIQGADGLGKRTLAKKLAGFFVCENKDFAPCGHCHGCKMLLAGSHPDVRVIKGTGKSNNVSVDSVRFIIGDSSLIPEICENNVYIIEAGKRLTEAVQNTLLKVIEEPPEGAVFIITMENAETLLPTIISRATIFTLHTPQKAEAAKYCAENTKKSADEREKAAELYGGNIGRMLSYLNGDEKGKAQDIAAKIASLVISGSDDSLLRATFPLIKDRQLFLDTLFYLSDIFRDANIIKAGGSALIGTDRESAEKLANSKSRAVIYPLPELCTEYRKLCEGNANMKLLVTAFCSALRDALEK